MAVARKNTATPKQQNALALLRADHKKVSELFAQYEKTRSGENKRAIVAEISTGLAINAQIEKEIFYPAVKAALKDKELVPEALVEHASLKALIAEVEGAEPEGEMFDAKIKVMSEFVKHHVKEEQDEMFPKAEQTTLDMDDLGAQLAERKEELLAEKETA